MLKEYLTLPSIISLFLILIVLIVSLVSPEYIRYSYYGAIVIMIPFIISDLLKKKKEDKIDGTKHFKISVYNILIAIAMMVVLFFLINSNYPS
ncbi:hypothetical protein ACHRVK_10710 [Flavobacterium plurextorum]|uniref:hypothetical protein n=1 Tax=Flavobacterium plurextorum TaxID=1114867 RepID=UPI0037568CAD